MKEGVESQFHLLITVSLFFPVVVSNLATIVGQSAAKASLILLQTSLVVGLYLLDYLLFQHRKNELTDGSLKWIERILLAALGIFIVPIVGLSILSFNPPAWIASPAAWLSGTSVLFVLAAPPTAELAILFSAGRKE